MESGEAVTSMEAILQVHLLGAPETRWAGELRVIPRRQPRAILYRLAARLEPVPRSQLCLLFWGDAPESEARRHLSNQIYNLRQALPDPELIQTQDDHLRLDRQRSWSDAAAFDRLSRNSEMVALEKAVELYRGAFLEGFSLAEEGEFSLWADRQRRRLERRYLESLSALMAAYAAEGKQEAAIACARRYLEIDDLAEEVHRKLIDLYAAQGDRSAALRQYERCVAILDRELGVDPLPETREVYQAVLEEWSIRGGPRFAPPTWTTLPSLDAPLVGREAAMGKLEAALAQTHAGAGSAVLVSGEAGVGKSRLLETFVREHAGEAAVLNGSGYEGQGEVPYLPLVEALRPLLPRVDWASLKADPLHLAALVRLLPELRRHVPNLPEPSSVEGEQEESPLIRGLAHLVLRLAERYPPLVLCLDDLHWADETTRAWVGYLGRRLREAPLLIIGG